jgi:hypothetical protein
MAFSDDARAPNIGFVYHLPFVTTLDTHFVPCALAVLPAESDHRFSLTLSASGGRSSRFCLGVVLMLALDWDRDWDWEGAHSSVQGTRRVWTGALGLWPDTHACTSLNFVNT